MLEHERVAALARYRLLGLHLEEGVLLARVARKQGIILRTAQRWLRRYHDDGVVELVPRPRRSRDLNLPARPHLPDSRHRAPDTGAEHRRHQSIG